MRERIEQIHVSYIITNPPPHIKNTPHMLYLLYMFTYNMKMANISGRNM